MMKTDDTYNGHPDHAHWNAALWIGNDEGLYHAAHEALLAADWDCRTAGVILAGWLAEEWREREAHEDDIALLMRLSDGWWMTQDGVPMTPALCEYAIRCCEFED